MTNGNTEKSCGNGNINPQQLTTEDNIVVEIHKSFGALSYMQHEWDDFMEGIGGEVFLTFDWCRLWWKYYGHNRDLFVFVFRKRDSLCGIIPMLSENIGLGLLTIRVLRLLGTDFTPVAVAIPIQTESIFEVVKSFVQKIHNNGSQWDIIHFGPISGRCSRITSLTEAFSCHKRPYLILKEAKGDVQTFIKLAGSWEEQLATLGKKQRAEMRRKYDRLIKSEVSLDNVDATSDNFSCMFDDFVKTHQSHWNNLGRPGHFGAWPFSYEFHRDVGEAQLRQGRLRFYKIMLNDNCIGYRYSYKFGDTYYCFLYARTEAGKKHKIDFSRIDYGMMVKRGIKEKVKCLDLMRGEYQHKSQLGGQIFQIKNIYLYSNRWIPVLKVSVFRALSKALNMSYYKIWRGRIAPKFRFKQRPLCRFWIRTNTLSG